MLYHKVIGYLISSESKIKRRLTNMQNNLYTAGELAKMAGVSLRTIHFYDIKGLLCPVDYSESGYRLYD